MTEQRHTDGPWVFEDYSQEEPEFFVVPATYYGTVAKVYREEDARLIAAAPEMLEALRKLAAEVGGLRAFESELRAEISATNWNVLMLRLSEAAAAIAKATGQ